MTGIKKNISQVKVHQSAKNNKKHLKVVEQFQNNYQCKTEDFANLNINTTYHQKIQRIWRINIGSL